jgi:hypothetical protein
MARIPTIRAVLQTIERARAELLAVLLVAAKKMKEDEEADRNSSHSRKG